MISGAIVLFLLASGVDTLHCSLGVPVTIDYSIPDIFVPEPLRETEDFVLLEQRGDSVTIMPMVLDSLFLPSLFATADTLEMEFPAPVIRVVRTKPDTTWSVPVFTSPLTHSIPPGFAEDYINRHRFWDRWGRSPSNRWLLPAIISAVAILVAILIWLLRRKRKGLTDVHPVPGQDKTLSCLDEVKALLDSKAFAEGSWRDYYREVDRLLRDTVAIRFGVSNRAYTWNQIIRQLAGENDGKRFSF